MATTLVAVFDDVDQAQRAAAELRTMGADPDDVSVTRSDPESGYATYGGESWTPASAGKTHKRGISGFFENLFGSDVDDNDRGFYSEAVRRGSVVLTTSVDDADVDPAIDVLERYGSVDVSRRAAQYESSGFTGYDESAPLYTTEQSRSELERFGSQGEVTLPVVEEQLKVGKRQVQRGGVRIYSRVTERPVEERIDLREEHVRVERRPVDRAVSGTDAARFRESEFTLTETAEEAVVAKEARVVEEVVVGKETTERTETVRDNVRRTDVDVEQISDVDSERRPFTRDRER